MHGEIESEETGRPVQILGVNGIGRESGNSSMTAGRILPWLQPASGDDVWTSWQVEYRDVVILGPGNERLSTFNLAASNLSDPVSYATLKNQLLEFANE